MSVETIEINGHTYKYEDLSMEAQRLVDEINYANEEIMERKMEIIKTAGQKRACIDELNNLLPQGDPQE